MRTLICAALVWAGVATAAFAQTSPNLVRGQVPTANQWNGYFSSKLDFSLPSGQIFVGNGSNVPVAVSPSGSCTVSGGGVFSCSAGPSPLADGHIYVGDGLGIPTDVVLSGDCTIVDTGAITCTKTNGTAIPLLGGPNTWSGTQTFSVAPIFTDASGTRTALGLGTAATVNTGTSGGTLCLANAVCTASAERLFVASTTANAGVNLAPGVAPTSPVNGDMWTTTTGVLARVNGATHQLDTASVTGAVKNNGSGTVSQAACADLSDGGNGGCAAKIVTGSLTPTLRYDTIGSSSFAYTTQSGYYRCLAGIVDGWVQITFTPTNGTGSGNLEWGNPPYSVDEPNGAQNPGISSMVWLSSSGWSGLSALPYFVTLWTAGRLSIGAMSGSTISYITNSNTTTATAKTVEFNFSYQTNSAC